ncbi:MAG TPA: PilZ domain-containing protein, partial [Nitrospirota bacterium]
ETNHANMASMQIRIVRAKPKDFGEVEFNFTDFKQVTDAIEVVRSMPADKIKEILLQCYIIESSPVEQYVVSALRNANQEFGQLLDMLGHGFREHLASLAAQVKALGVDITKVDTARRHPRVALSARTVINDTIYAKSVDISESGMFLLTARFFPVGTKMSVTFPLMNGTVSAKGDVRYSVPNAGIAIVFTDLSEKDRALIGFFVDSVIAAHLPERHQK